MRPHVPPSGARAAARAALLGAALLVAATTAAKAQTMPPLATLLRQFEVVAFTSEFGGTHRQSRLIKWQEPVVIRLRGANAEAHREEVEAQLVELRQLSGLAMTIVAAHDLARPVNLTLEFSRSIGSTRFEPQAPCRTLIYDRNFVIRRVEIYITPEPAEVRRHCIAEELTQALGLANDSGVIADSIFNDASRRQRIAPWDALMVRTLYDQRLAPGAHKTVALPLARDILALLLIERQHPAMR